MKLASMIDGLDGVTWAGGGITCHSFGKTWYNTSTRRYQQKSRQLRGKNFLLLWSLGGGIITPLENKITFKT